MKKIFTIISAMLISAAALSAQNTEMYENGYRADIELSAAIANQFVISSSHGYSFGDGLYIGGGAGFGAEFTDDYSKATFIVPIFADLKYTFLDQKCSPFVGIRAGEIIDINNNGLRASLNPSVGVDIARFSIKAGYEFQYGVMGAGEGTQNHYAKIGVAFTF